MGHFDFNGTLALVFGSNFTSTPGSSFKLFDFNRFSGSLDSSHHTVAGLDRNLLDFTHLASNGNLHIVAVPLPAATRLSREKLLLAKTWPHKP